MRRIACVACVCALVSVGCAGYPPAAMDPAALAECVSEPEAVAIGRGHGERAIAASVLPLPLPAELQAVGGEPMELARRVVVTFAPGSLRPGESLIWTRLELRTLGGTLAGWTRIRSPGVSIDLTPSAQPPKMQSASRVGREQVAVDAGAGYLAVERVSSTSRGVSSTVSLDLLIRPGGVPVDESVVRASELWTSDANPVSTDRVHIELVPVHHAPGYDSIEADVALDYIVWHGRGTLHGNAARACKGSAQGHITLVDKDAVRPALWDLGTSTLNAPRTRWLALSSPATGVVRAIFDSPDAAISFANWIRATGSSQAGGYHLGLFAQSGPRPLRPLVPVDVSAPETFAPLTPRDTSGLRVGRLGEP